LRASMRSTADPTMPQPSCPIRIALPIARHDTGGFCLFWAL